MLHRRYDFKKLFWWWRSVRIKVKSLLRVPIISSTRLFKDRSVYIFCNFFVAVFQIYCLHHGGKRRFAHLGGLFEVAIWFIRGGSQIFCRLILYEALFLILPFLSIIIRFLLLRIMLNIQSRQLIGLLDKIPDHIAVLPLLAWRMRFLSFIFFVFFRVDIVCEWKVQLRILDIFLWIFEVDLVSKFLDPPHFPKLAPCSVVSLDIF